MPFNDLFEQAHVFGLLDELANQSNQQAITDFRNPNYVLMRRLFLLMLQIQEVEVQQRLRPAESYQYAIVRNLVFALEDCKYTGELKEALPEIKVALLRAWVIRIELEYGALVPVANKGRAFDERQKRSGFLRWEGDQEAHVQWQKWQADEETENPKFRTLTKQAKAMFLKKKHQIDCTSATIAKRLNPLSPSKTKK